VGLPVSELFLFDVINPAQDNGLIILIHLVQHIKQFDNLELFVGSISFDIELKISFFALPERFNKLKQGICRPVRHHRMF
jgi:hypothetical protein